MSDRIDIYSKPINILLSLPSISRDNHGNVAKHGEYIACSNGELVSLQKGWAEAGLTPHQVISRQIEEAQVSQIRQSMELVLWGKTSTEYTESPYQIACRAAARRSFNNAR